MILTLVVVCLVLVVLLAYQQYKNQCKIAALGKKLTELEVRIVARMEDRLTTIESDFEDLDLACQRAVVSADLNRDEQQ